MLLVSIVVILLFIRHRRLNAGSTNRLVLSDTATAGTSGAGYGTGSEAPRGFMNPMYDDPTERVSNESARASKFVIDSCSSISF